MDQPGNVTLTAAYEVVEFNKVIEAKPVTLSVRKIDKVELKPKEILLPPGETYQFSLSVEGKDTTGRNLEMSDIQEYLRWSVEPPTMGKITEDGTLTAGAQPGKCFVKAYLEGIEGMDDKSKVLLVTTIYLDILNMNDDKSVKETTLTIASGQIVKLEYTLATTIPNIQPEELTASWILKEAMEYGTATPDQKRLMFKAGSKSTPIPIKIGVAVSNVPENAKRKDGQTAVWLQIHSKPPIEYFKLGEDLLKMKNRRPEDIWPDALQAFSTAIEIDPKYGEAYLRRARIYLKQRQFATAEKDFLKAVEFLPKDNTIYYSMACMYGLQNNEKEALDYLEKAVQKGYKKYSQIMKDKDLTSIRKSKGFRSLIKKYKLDQQSEEDEESRPSREED
jgi:tetratricopeptide (TPR) repeat protein